MKLIKRTRYGKQTIARDAHAPETVYVETVTNDKAGIERNRRIRGAGLMKIGQRVPVIDEHADVSTSFQFPSQMDYILCKARNPDLFAQLEQGGEDAIRAGERLALLEPQYVTSIRRQDHIR